MLNRTARSKKVLEEVLVLGLLVAIGVAGRWGQPDWGFTPIAAVSIFAGFYFGRRWVSLLVPLGVLGISDLALPAYGSRGVLFIVYAAMALPVFLGGWLRQPAGTAMAALKFAACGLLPATLFFVLTNWAVWQFGSDYEPTLAGLSACYVAALPFYRAMLVGDVVYVTVLFGCYGLATSNLRRPAVQSAKSR